MPERIACIIAARGGSKGLPGKNLALVGGRSLIARAIDAARGSGCVDRTIVTTDADDIAEEARRHGAEVPFKRPPELALDGTPGIDPIRHAVRWLEGDGYVARWVVILQPTSPLRTGEDVAGAVALAREQQPDKVVSVMSVTAPPQWMLVRQADGSVVPFLPPQADQRRQAMGDLFIPNGAVYVYSRDAVFAEDTSGLRALPYVMPRERSVDVDTPYDLELARWLHQRSTSSELTSGT